MFLDVTPAPVADATNIAVQLLYPIFLTTLTAVIGFVGAEVRKWVKAHTTSEQVTAFQKIAVIAVTAAEQMFGEAEGEKKFEYAKSYIELELAKRGINVEVDQIQAQIESAVLEQFNYPAVEPTPPAESVVTTDSDLYPGLVGDLDEA